jgi:3-deoxy-D-arabino-heptulosonate 7-phosphate (DAHP) synthase class II
MFQAMFNKIRSFFKGTNSVTNGFHSYSLVLKREALKNEYSDLASELKSANDLMKLVTLRKKIQQFKQVTIDQGEEIWGRPYVTALVRVWNLKYRSWKGR